MILDLCCGQGRHSLEIVKRGYSNVVGLDRSHYLIARARKINKALGLNVTFKEGDARNLRFQNDSFDAIIIAGNSFGYFETVQDDVRILKEVRRILKPDGKLLIDITDGEYMREHFQPRSWEWIDKNYFVCRERSLSENSERLVSREVITHVNKGVIADQFYAERLYSKNDLNNLFKDSGFKDYQEHSKILTESKRNQDLGMMAERIIVTAVAEKEWSTFKKQADVKDTVVVLMGDPKKLDAVKPNSTFDEDDYHTIKKLKKALSKLSKYQVIYMDQHDTLIKDLEKIKTKCRYVFNLCDEGFNNEASKELHIVALLEILGLHYSGGTPQCLAFCYDKSLIRGIAMEMDIPVSNAFMIKPEDIQFIEFPVKFPVIVKPNFGDSSFGITQNNVCYDMQNLENIIIETREKFGYDNPILVEEFLTGKDISVGIIGNPPNSYRILPIIQEDYSELPEELPQICGYEAKWDPNSPYSKIKSVPADLPEDVERFLSASCLKLFERLQCRDYARFDWRLDGNGTPRLLEVNPNPGWCWDGHLAKMAQLEGLSYSSMLESILEACKSRI
ncbi:MAG: D-alanine-D-alanine ligase [Candidatus Magnetoglobus multicellularis str. Araruama]|uniref:D-alanine-D-alanine ligase n=1 Tax=Candidatus Magnetoglobus multicellularis str. Araruama TaxID=890399 RepID=A0A1V1P6U0_9BACT|nr:MAG: D-alanine-D-alanine ligase [Candidatus Magnetoglobus multicellularis str. Araruama]